MTDADVDGAHIAALLMTYFYREMPQLVEAGRLYLAQPPLYRLTQGGKTVYALDEEQREASLKDTFDGRGKVEISRFKGLGEMPPSQLKETTMNPASRRLLQVSLPLRDAAASRSGNETCSKRRLAGFIVVSFNCDGGISPSPLKRLISTLPRPSKVSFKLASRCSSSSA